MNNVQVNSASQTAAMTAPVVAALPAAIHATAVVISETGILIRGPAGAGKSALARAMITLARQTGAFARLLGDDQIRISAHGGRLIGRPHPQIAGLMEVRGQGIIKKSHEPAAVLHCVIELVSGPADCGDLPRLPEKSLMQVQFGAIFLPRLRLSAKRPIADNAMEGLDYIRSISTPGAK